MLQAEKSKSSALESKARYCDQVLMSDGLLPVSVIAKDYGMTAMEFNRLLNRLGIQFKLGGSWLLYKRYSGKGYTRTRTYCTPGGVCVIHTYWTQKGRQFLYDTLCSCGLSPLAEGRHGQMMLF
jgi:phage antirepressor YoqD-like protein